MTSPASSTDDKVAEVLGEMLAARRAGNQREVDRLLHEHVSLAPEMKSLWGAAVLAEELAHESLDFEPAATVSQQLNDAAALSKSFGDYELLEELGRGGMGVVYKARQKSLGRIVALKMILRGPAASSIDLARFRAEAESAARLDHPHIVPVYEVGEVEGLPYFGMRYIEGNTLARALIPGPFEGRKAAAMMIPIARAIAAAHRGGILHRDLKPSNILLDEHGESFVGDFGLAKRVETGNSMTVTGAILGTPSYMAPEQAAGNRGSIGPATDVYGLGAILYHALTGRPPFQAATPVDTLLLVLEQEPLPPRMLNQKIDPVLEMIVLKALEKSSEMRYASADELAADLQAFLNSEPVSAQQTSLVHWFQRMFRETHHAPVLERWGLLWMLHSGVLLTLCLLTEWFHWRRYTAPWPYLAIWTFGLGCWAAIFWSLRRRGGPITFVERQIAHVWGAGVISSTLLFLVEMVLGLPVLTLSPVLAIVGGIAFLVKASILSGTFYVQAAANFACALLMAAWPDYGLIIFGVVNALSFFIPGWKYYHQGRTAESDSSAGLAASTLDSPSGS